MLAGLNYSIEFTGGTLVQIRSQKTVDVAQLRSGLDQQGIHGAEIQGFGAPNEYVIRARVAKPGTDAERHPGHGGRGLARARRGAGAGQLRGAPHRGGRPQGRRRAPAEGLPGDLPLLLRGAGLPGVPVRVALRPRRGDRDGARHSGHHRLHRRDAARGEPHDRGRGAVDGGLLAERHDHHLRPGAGEPEEVQEGPVRDGAQPRHQRDAAAERPDPRHHAGHAASRWRSSAAR